MKLRTTVTAWGLYSVWQRHARVYQKTWLVNFLPPITEPIVYLVTFGFGLTPIIKQIFYAGQQIGYLQFLAPGMIAIGIMSQSYFEGAYGGFVRLNFQKTWQALLTAPLSFTEVFLGDWLWAATRGTIAGVITGIVAVIWGLYSGWNLLLSLPLIFLGSLLFGAMGLLTAGLIRTIDQINVPVFLLIVPMYTLCGTYFPRETLPDWLRLVSSILPLSPLTNLLRWNLGLPNFWFLDLLWLLVCTLVLAAIAWKAIYPQLFR
jgi:lipooligosaccharide transport system permease protein